MKDEPEKCAICGEVKPIKMRCNFCEDGWALCKECAEEHRSWCMAKDDWEFL